MASGCTIALTIGVCGAPTASGCPLSLCERHLAAAYEHCRDLIEQRRRADLQHTRAAIDETRALAVERLRLADAEAEASQEVDDHESVVYYLQFGNRVKIGFSRNLANRMTIIPHDRLLAIEPGGRVVEARRHRQFAQLRITGEWFTAAEPLLSHADGLAEQYLNAMRELFA